MFDLFKCQMKGIICVHMQNKVHFYIFSSRAKSCCQGVAKRCFPQCRFMGQNNWLHASLLTLQ